MILADWFIKSSCSSGSKVLGTELNNPPSHWARKDEMHFEKHDSSQLIASMGDRAPEKSDYCFIVVLLLVVILQTI